MSHRISFCVAAGLLGILSVTAPARAETPPDTFDAFHEMVRQGTDLRVQFQLAALTALSQEADEAPEAELEAPEEERLNRIGLFLGATSKVDETAFAFGGEYERRLSEPLGLGLVLEWTPGLREPVLAAPAVYLHPVGELVVLLSPGVTFEEGGKFLFRFGVAWEFELGGGFSVAPTVNYDLVADVGDAIVWGVITSYSF
jgi:hypothetical protein